MGTQDNTSVSVHWSSRFFSATGPPFSQPQSLFCNGALQSVNTSSASCIAERAHSHNVWRSTFICSWCGCIRLGRARLDVVELLGRDAHTHDVALEKVLPFYEGRVEQVFPLSLLRVGLLGQPEPCAFIRVAGRCEHVETRSSTRMRRDVQVWLRTRHDERRERGACNEKGALTRLRAMAGCPPRRGCRRRNRVLLQECVSNPSTHNNKESWMACTLCPCCLTISRARAGPRS